MYEEWEENHEGGSPTRIYIGMERHKKVLIVGPLGVRREQSEDGGVAGSA